MPDVYPLNPSDATLIAHQVDAVFIFILAISAFFFVLTQGLLIYFALRYRRKKGEQAAPTPFITGNTVLEIAWVIIPSLLLVAIFGYGMVVFLRMRTPIPGAAEIQVVGSQFQWGFKYPDGRSSLNELRVPVGKPVKLIMTSKDVLHGFFIPGYRQKQDVLPGRYTYLWLLPRQTGSFDIYCSQYCGSGHSIMRARLIVMPEAAYLSWEEAEEKKLKAGTLSIAERGEHVFFGIRLPGLPQHRRQPQGRPDPQGNLRKKRHPGKRQDRHSGRGVPTGVAGGPQRQGGEGIPAHHAFL